MILQPLNCLVACILYYLPYHYSFTDVEKRTFGTLLSNIVRGMPPGITRYFLSGAYAESAHAGSAYKTIDISLSESLICGDLPARFLSGNKSRDSRRQRDGGGPDQGMSLGSF